MTQHTPGPWTVDVEDECRVIDVQDCTVARTDYVEIEEERDWQVANAALIAAAPIMRDALLGLLDWYDMDEGDLRPLMTAARHALAGVESDGKQREACKTKPTYPLPINQMTQEQRKQFWQIKEDWRRLWNIDDGTPDAASD